MIFRIVLAFISTFSFAVLFSAPRSQYVFCGLCGCFTWGLYLMFINFSFGEILSALFATFFVTVLARFLSIMKKNPVTIYLVTGILPLVPGAAIYYTAYYFIMGEGSNSAAMGIEAFKYAGSIAIGVVFGFAVPIQTVRKYLLKN